MKLKCTFFFSRPFGNYIFLLVRCMVCNCIYPSNFFAVTVIVSISNKYNFGFTFCSLQAEGLPSDDRNEEPRLLVEVS